ncbi:MAG: SDR family oxidoreductase [Lachnospiraceae bacterium]|nr:SDR family oxidoreductase [Lachnospiraceae bacterium]MEE3460564.1 SDR family oxidoreductase [Lachnospiraceae bacterium]
MLQGKTAVITGTGRGIGKAAAIEFAKNHAKVYACMRKEDPDLENEFIKTAEEYGTQIIPVYFDITDFKVAAGKIKEIALDNEKKIDILVNNAGISIAGLLQMTPMNELEDTLRVNFLAQLNLIQIVSKFMMRRKSGSIINVASVSGLHAEKGRTAYGSSKAALLFATKCLARELGPYSIRVNSISPGFIDTDMWKTRSDELKEKILSETPLGRLGRPEEAAKVILFLASEMSSFITGQNIIVDGGRDSHL